MAASPDRVDFLFRGDCPHGTVGIPLTKNMCMRCVKQALDAAFNEGVTAMLERLVDQGTVDREYAQVHADSLKR